MHVYGALKEKPHKHLDAWHVAMGLVSRVYEAAAAFPKTEQFGPTDQMRRQRSAFQAISQRGRHVS